MKLHIFAPMLLLVAASFYAPAAHAQILSRGNLFGPGAPPPMVGVEIGFGEHSQQGNLLCDCGANFTTGTGTGLLGSLLFELPLDYEWAVGIKGGIDFKNFSTNANELEDVIVVPPNTSQLDTVPMYVNRTGKVTATYLGFTPYVQYQFFRMGPFVQGGVDVGFLVSNNLTQDRQLLQTSVTTQSGLTLNNLTFANGTTSESIQEGANKNVNTLRLGLLLSAGYNIQVSERSVLSPLLTYDFPLTATGNTSASNWKIGSLYATAEIKFRLD
ncbi:MAG TPA: hypothetical protein VFX22_09110 [Candidatus Kapabacteria bacterium]|nr:hypothetical protein [Candidatus Kapabacteria bacterium]